MKSIIVKPLLVLLLMALFLGSCSNLPFIGKSADREESSPHDAIQSKQAAIEHEINTMLNDDNYYWGRGTADIVTGYTNARNRAKENAITDLSRRLSIQVSSELIRTLANVSVYDDHRYSESEQEIIRERTTIITERVLSNIHGDREFIDHPREGVITYILRISRQEYEEEVTKSLNQNKNMINSFIRTGNNDYTAGRYMSAVNHWTQAKEMILNIFGGLPIFHDINDDGNNEEFNSYLNERISDFFSNVRFSLTDESVIIYDAQGNVRSRPVVLAHYLDKAGNEQPVGNLPIKVNAVEGRVNLPRQIETGTYGQVELSLNNLDASYANTILRVETETDRISRIELFSLPMLSSLNIRLERMKTMALSVTLVNDANVSTPNSLLQTLKRAIINKGFSVTEIDIKTDSFSISDLSKINNSNADYFLNVFLNISGVQPVGDVVNAFYANCSGSVNLYRLPGTDNNVASEPVAAERGFGANPANAGMNAFANTIQKIERQVDSIISGI